MVIKCFECTWSGQYIEYKIHYKTHEKISCPYCKIIFSEERLLNNHLDSNSGNCEQQPMPSLYLNIVCCNNDPKFNRNMLEEHSLKNIQSHLDLVYNDLMPRLKKVENYYLSQNTNLLNASNPPTLSLLSQAKSSIKDYEVRETVNSLRASNGKAKKQPLTETLDLPDNEGINFEISKFDSKLEGVGGDLNSYIRIAEKLNKELEDTNSNEKKLKDEIANLQKSLTFAQTTIVNLDERLLTVENATYNGTYIWKITNVREKIQEAVSGRQASLNSHPFYSCQYGYKMCARIYLNGDGEGKNTHISIFFVLMRGEHDNLLKWPFQGTVTFSLIDQTNDGREREDIEEGFEVQLQKIGSFRIMGLPLFCSLQWLNSQIHEYVKDDCMFIKVVAADLTETKTIFDDVEIGNVHIKTESFLSYEQK